MNPNATTTLRSSRTRRLVMTGLALGLGLSAAAATHAQSLTPPPTSDKITAPAGNSLFLVGHATGTQGYTCLPTSPGAATASWTVKPARPEATLFQRVFGLDIQIVTHFLSPDANPNGNVTGPVPFGSATWQSSFDSSKVWAAVLHDNVVVAGTEPACPNGGSIPCLLLESIGNQAGPSGGTILAKTSFVQRLNTNGGTAPADGCATAGEVGKQALVPYTADYFFYRKDK